MKSQPILIAVGFVVIAALCVAGFVADRRAARGDGDGEPAAVLAVKGALTWDDVREIEAELPPAAPYLSRSIQLIADDSNWMAQVVGTTPDYFAIRGLELAAGTRFEGTGKLVVLGETTAAQLFGKRSAIGATIRLDRMPFEVVGVLAHRGLSPTGQDLDDVALVPIQIYTQRLAPMSKSRFAGAMYLPSAASVDALRQLLRVRHGLAAGEPDDFTIAGLP